MNKKRTNRETKFYERVCVFIGIAAMVGRCLALGSFRSASIYEGVIDRQNVMIQELRQVDKENCINLFLNDKI